MPDKDSGFRAGSIDKSTISRPLPMHPQNQEEEELLVDTRTPRQQVVDVIVARLRQVDNFDRGVDLESIRPMCEKDLNQLALQAVRDAGGWSAFILANTDGKTIKSFREGNRIIILPGKSTNVQDLGLGIRELSIRDSIAATDESPSAIHASVHFDAPEGRMLGARTVRDDDDDAPARTTQTDKAASSKPVKLSAANHEVVALLPTLLQSTRTEFFKDGTKQRAMQTMRAMTLLMRFRDIFQGRSYAAIIARLAEEGDVKKLGGIDQLFEMGVQLGYLEIKKKDNSIGHVATAKGASLIYEAPAAVIMDTMATDLTLLQQQIEENFENLRPTKDSERVRGKILRELQRHLDRAFPQCGFLVELFGSSGTGLYFPGSDSDVCAYYKTVPPTKTIDIRQLGNSFRRQNWCSNICIVAFAKIPVVKFVHTASGLPIDVSIENTIAIENTRLIKIYMNLDPRVKPLAFALKVWCKSRSISHPEEGTLSSYSWVLLLIHFLQRRQPPILPNLQAHNGQHESFTHSYNGEVIECYYDENPTFTSTNTESVAELFAAFFHYYTVFDFAQLCINIQPSLRADGSEPYPLRKSEKGHTDWGNKTFAIQDPFIRRRNTGVGCSPMLAEWTLNEIKRAHRILSAGGSFADIVTFLRA